MGGRGNAGFGVPAHACGADPGERGHRRDVPGDLSPRLSLETAPRTMGAGARRAPSGGTMITLTESAAGKVKELLTEEGRDDIALRVAVQPGGCSGLRYAMYLDDQVTDKDAAAEQFGVRIVVDKMSAPY